jgi:hypothetical protein
MLKLVFQKYKLLKKDKSVTSSLAVYTNIIRVLRFEHGGRPLSL